MSAGIEDDTIYPSEKINTTVEAVAKDLDINLHNEVIHSSDVFYAQANEIEELGKIIGERDLKAVEMESFALFSNAKALGKNAACILTVSDNIVTGTATTSEERQKTFTKMMELALETSIKL